MPREKFGSSSLVSSIDYRKVQQQELATKLDGNFAAKCNCTRHVIYARPCVYLTIIIQQIVTMPIYGKEVLNICHPYMTDILRYT